MSTAHETVHWHATELTTLFSIESNLFLLFVCRFLPKRFSFIWFFNERRRAFWHTCNTQNSICVHPWRNAHTHSSTHKFIWIAHKRITFRPYLVWHFLPFLSASDSLSLARSLTASFSRYSRMNEYYEAYQTAPRDTRLQLPFFLCDQYKWLCVYFMCYTYVFMFVSISLLVCRSWRVKLSPFVTETNHLFDSINENTKTWKLFALDNTRIADLPFCHGFWMKEKAHLAHIFSHGQHTDDSDEWMYKFFTQSDTFYLWSLQFFAIVAVFGLFISDCCWQDERVFKADVCWFFSPARSASSI